MMHNVLLEGVTRAKDYAFRVENLGTIADASANFFFGLRSIITWGGLYMTASDPTPTIDSSFFGLRFQTLEHGIFLDRGTQSTSAVAANGFWGVMIDTSSDTALGVEDGGARNHFERLVAENTTAHITGFLQNGYCDIYLNIAINSYDPKTQPSMTPCMFPVLTMTCRQVVLSNLVSDMRLTPPP